MAPGGTWRNAIKNKGGPVIVAMKMGVGRGVLLCLMSLSLAASGCLGDYRINSRDVQLLDTGGLGNGSRPGLLGVAGFGDAYPNAMAVQTADYPTAEDRPSLLSFRKKEIAGAIILLSIGIILLIGFAAWEVTSVNDSSHG